MDATPKHSRIRTDLHTTPEARRHAEPATTTSASTISRIPSSGAREADSHDEHIPSTARQQAVEATPVRAIKFAMPALPASVARQAPAAVFETPIKARRGDLLVAQTPVQDKPIEANEVEETPGREAMAGTSIYEALGWDD